MRPAAEDAVAPPGAAATRNRGRRDRRYAVVMMALGATCVALACVAWAQGGGARTVAALQEMLCCDGCCAASAIPVSVTSAILEHDTGDERHGRSTILHLAGSAEIDYTAGGHRVYGHAHLDRLAFIRKGRELGFSLDSIRNLLMLSERRQDASCAEVHKIAISHLTEVRSKITDLKVLETVLVDALEDCGRTSVEDCRVLDALRGGAGDRG